MVQLAVKKKNARRRQTKNRGVTPKRLKTPKRYVYFYAKKDVFFFFLLYYKIISVYFWCSVFITLGILAIHCLDPIDFKTERPFLSVRNRYTHRLDFFSKHLHLVWHDRSIASKYKVPEWNLHKVKNWYLCFFLGANIKCLPWQFPIVPVCVKTVDAGKDPSGNRYRFGYLQSTFVCLLEHVAPNNGIN